METTWEYLTTPIVSQALNILTMAGTAFLIGLLGFIAVFSFKLGSKLWPLVALFAVGFLFFSIRIPTPNIRSILSGAPFPPGDTVRLLMLAFGLGSGITACYYQLKHRLSLKGA